MKAVSAGHSYNLHNMAGNRIVGILNFMKKENGKLLHEGTTTEEVIDVLIDRITVLNDKFQCKENLEAIDYLTKAKQALEARTADRTRRGVEGKDKA